jgi:translocator protein
VPAAVWGALTLAVATALGVRMLRVYRDAAYAAVLVWAFVGIVVMQIGTALVAATAVLGVVTLAYVAALTFRAPGG